MPALQELSPPEVALTDKPISVEEFKCVGSYTWLAGPQPKIAIPGKNNVLVLRVFDVVDVFFARGIVRPTATVAGPPVPHSSAV